MVAAQVWHGGGRIRGFSPVTRGRVHPAVAPRRGLGVARPGWPAEASAVTSPEVSAVPSTRVAPAWTRCGSGTDRHHDASDALVELRPSNSTEHGGAYFSTIPDVFTRKRRQETVMTDPAAPLAPMVPVVGGDADVPPPVLRSAALAIQAGTPRISADWLAWPTLGELPSGPDVVGVTFHRPELGIIMDFWGPLFMAELVARPSSELSAPVVLVVGGVVVGSVPRRIAGEYRRAVDELHRSGKRALCRVSASPGPVAPLLLIHGAPRPRQLGDPFLPPTGAGDRVVLDPAETGRLQSVLEGRVTHLGPTGDPGSEERTAVATATLTPRIDRLEVQLGGRRVGHLTGRYPLVEKAANFEYPLTCRALMGQAPGQEFGLHVFVPR
jgi:hypothetical protein